MKKRWDFMKEERVYTLEDDIKFIIDSGYTFSIEYIKDGTFSVVLNSVIFPTAEMCEFPQWRGSNLRELINEATGYVDQQNQYTEAIVYDYFFRGREELKQTAEKILNFRGKNG
jgi:hypothetical protein